MFVLILGDKPYFCHKNNYMQTHATSTEIFPKIKRRLHGGFLFGLFFLTVSLFSAQVSKAQDVAQVPDTIYVNDTIYETRSVEKVVYVYHTPQHYLSVGAAVYGELPRYSAHDGYSQSATGDGGGISVQFSRGRFIADAGIGVRNYSRNMSRTYQSPHFQQTTYMHSDTLSYYDVTLNSVTTRRYITKQTERDTVLVDFTDSAVSYRNTYQYLCLPLMAGMQHNFGFLSVDAKLGLVPSILAHAGSCNTAVLTDGTAVAEDEHIRRFGCDAAASLSLRYLLTVKMIVGADVLYCRSIVPMGMDGAAKLTRQGVALQAGISFLLFDFE